MNQTIVLFDTEREAVFCWISLKKKKKEVNWSPGWRERWKLRWCLFRRRRATRQIRQKRICYVWWWQQLQRQHGRKRREIWRNICKHQTANQQQPRCRVHTRWSKICRNEGESVLYSMAKSIAKNNNCNECLQTTTENNNPLLEVYSPGTQQSSAPYLAFFIFSCTFLINC